MRKALLIMTAVLALGAAAETQCPMKAKIDDNAVLQLRMPDGKEVPVDEGMVLHELGEYRLWAVVDNFNGLMDTTSLTFTLTGEEMQVEVSLSCYDKYDVFFSVTRHLIPPKEIEIAYDKYVEANGNVFPGPYFRVKNGSNDTLFGYWLPDYLWGSVEVMKDGVPLGMLGATIDYNFSGGQPCLPHTEDIAIVGSFGRQLGDGQYRFHLLYSTHRQLRGYTLTREESPYRWFTSVQSWYDLTCDFTKE